MQAAVVNTFGVAPTFETFREPAAGDGETVVRVTAAPLSPIVRSLAAGRHYTSGASAGFVPGIDGVGVDDLGRRVYFLFPKAPFGSMAERSLVDRRMTVPVPDALSDDRAAAIGTAGLAAWIALTRRAPLRGGETVLVLGATGAAGGLALPIARHLGAGKLIAVGRDEARLAALDADVRIALGHGDDIGATRDADAALRAQFDAGIDVVLDFVWGEPAVRVLRAATARRAGPLGEPRLRHVQIGTIAGEEIPMRGDMFRSTGLELLGSGIGAVSLPEFIAGAGELLAAAPIAGFQPPSRTMPLRAVADAWATGSDVRVILAPQERD